MGTAEVVKDTNEGSNEISELENKIIRQIEYYFGNFNLSKDKFLRDQLKLDDGWVPLETMLLFKRLKSLTEDPKVICESLKKSPNELMEVDEECTKIRRRVDKPLPDASREAQEERTLYVKGFKKTNTLDELLEFFKEFKAEHIAMRRYKAQKDKPFKGSCFVMFETKEDAEKFLANKEIKYGNTVLLKEMKKDYLARKEIEFQNFKAEKEKKRAEKGDKDDTKTEVDNEENKDGDGKPDPSWLSGCLIKLVGLGKNCSREDITEVFEKHGTVAYVDYNRGLTEGYVRFESAIAAKVVEDIAEEDGEKKIEILEAKVTVSLVEEDAEKEYWKSLKERKANARKNFKSNRGGFKNKNWNRGKRNNQDGDGGNQRKKQKMDANDD